MDCVSYFTAVTNSALLSGFTAGVIITVAVSRLFITTNTDVSECLSILRELKEFLDDTNEIMESNEGKSEQQEEPNSEVVDCDEEYSDEESANERPCQRRRTHST